MEQTLTDVADILVMREKPDFNLADIEMIWEIHNG